MSKLTSLKDISNISKEFRKDIIQPDGRRVLKDKHLIYQNTIHFDLPYLDYDVLCELPRFLIRTSIFPNGARYGNIDQTVFWYWLAEVCFFDKWDYKHDDKRFKNLFGLLISSHMVNSSNISIPKNYHFARFIGDFHVLSACFAFPFLERCIRYKCKNYVSVDGSVLTNFQIPRYGKTDRPYNVGKFISNISHEVKLLYYYAFSRKFQKTLDKFFNELNKDSGLNNPDPFDLIGYWRNQLLHGQNIWSSGWEIATYLICLILLNYIPKKEYNSKISDLRKHVTWMQQTNSPYLWYFLEI